MNDLNCLNFAGNFGIVWSAKLRLGPRKEITVAMKKMKCKLPLCH